MSKLTKLTDAQHDFAAEHHDLLLRFLKEKGLRENDYYDIAVFGYLRAVQIYDERPELHSYSFKTIAYKRMYAALWNHFRSLRAQKRNAVVYSLSAAASDGLAFSECVSTNAPAVYEYAEIREEWETAQSAATPKQMQALRLRAQGYTGREIGNLYQISPSAVYGRIYTLREKTRRLAA